MSATAPLTWNDIVASFKVMRAQDLLAMDGAMMRHQAIRNHTTWLDHGAQPLALLFISHRWHTLEHPDPDGRDLRGIQQFLRRIAAAVDALLVHRDERLEIMGSLQREGDLQAEEIARRMLGFGPFADTTAASSGRNVRRAVGEASTRFGGDRPSFRSWILDRIGVWLDYVCMPQKPLEPADEEAFRRTLESLDSLVMSSTVVALRDGGDDYATRGWCATEFFLASARSFARGIFFDVGRMENGLEIVAEPAPATPNRSNSFAAEVIAQSYEQDATAFHRACAEWRDYEGAFADIVPPAAWAEYRSWQGSMFYPSASDPNPFRRALDAVRNIEGALIGLWLMGDREVDIDLAAVIGRFLEEGGVQCAEDADRAYLGLLMGQHGWVEWFRPLFQEGLKRYVAAMPTSHSPHLPALTVKLIPPPAELRKWFSAVSPSSTHAWHSRLSTQSGVDPQEKEAVDAVRASLDRDPLEYQYHPPTEHLDTRRLHQRRSD